MIIFRQSKFTINLFLNSFAFKSGNDNFKKPPRKEQNPPF